MLSPEIVNLSSDESKHSSVSPPRISGSMMKSDGSSMERQHYQTNPTCYRRKAQHLGRYRSRSHSRDRSPQKYELGSDSARGYKSGPQYRGRYSRNRRSRSRSKSSRNKRSRSRSRDRYYRNRRSRSHSHSRTTRNNRSRSREDSRKKHKSKSPSPKLPHHSEVENLKSAWETFQAEMSALKCIRAEEEKLYARDPEKHPDYKLEWKKFYKGRVQELVRLGDDPKLHNFESEWAYFWKVRMSELIDIDYEKKKVALKKRLKLPEDAEMPLYLQVKEGKEAALDGKEPPSEAVAPPSSNRFGNQNGLLSTLRLVTAVEEQLGSMGPQVNALLSEAVALQRITGGDPDTLLNNSENVILLETVKEKFFGQILSKIVKKSLEGAVQKAIDSICMLIQSLPPKISSTFQNQLPSSKDKGTWPQGCPNDTKLNLPGIGEVDRVAVAQQIADALVKQGKTDVTEAELQQLVNGVVGKLEAQALQERELASAKERLQIQEPVRVATEISKERTLRHETPVINTSSDLNLVAPSETPSVPDIPILSTNPSPLSVKSDPFSILMSVVNSGITRKGTAEDTHDWSSDDSDEPFPIKNTSLSSHNNNNPAKISDFQDRNENPRFKGELNRTRESVKRTPTPNSRGILASSAAKGPPKQYSPVVRVPSPEIFKSMKKRVAAAKEANMKRGVGNDRALSPFSCREDISNPSHNSEEDQNVVGAWDSDSDIDLDSFGKVKGLAYDKINVKRQSPGKYEKNLSLLNKSKEVLLNTVVLSPSAVGANINLDDAIDNLMGELKNKNSKQEVTSSKIQPVFNNPQKIVSLATGVSQPSQNVQVIPSYTQQIPSSKVVTTQAYSAPYYYPQVQSYAPGPVQHGPYNNPPVFGYYGVGGVSHNANAQGETASGYYNNHGNLVYCSTNTQWPVYHDSQQTNIPSNLRGRANNGKY